MKQLHIDIETFSSVDISAGVYKYVQSEDFEILMVAYALDDGPVGLIDLTKQTVLSDHALHAYLLDSSIEKHAHNANFERICFEAYGYDIPIARWFCSAIKSANCGLPLRLSEVSKALNFGEDKAKLATGKALIKYFSVPCKPTKVNGGRTRNLPEHDPVKWEQYKDYCKQDVEAEREIIKRLEGYNQTDFERKLYILDQEINDRGIGIDVDFAKSALRMDEQFTELSKTEMIELTGVENPNSAAQLKKWIGDATGKNIESLAKDKIPGILEGVQDEKIHRVLALRQLLSKTSTKKYVSMLSCICSDGRGRGFLQFYGANRTGRWAGRIVQLQNLPQNHIPDLQLARDTVLNSDMYTAEFLFGGIPFVLSQLIRTAFVAKKGHTLAVADFSSIEARVLAWLAGEQWRLDVFNTTGKIYETSASKMFGVPIESVTKGSDLRAKGKVSELALGYQGALGALTQMGGEKMGLSDDEMNDIVQAWRKASPKIVSMWGSLDRTAKKAIRLKGNTFETHGIKFYCGDFLTIELPSGRKLFYASPVLKKKIVTPKSGDPFEVEAITYMGMDQQTKQWVRLDTYGGKLTENIVQAIARDILAESMVSINSMGYGIVMHVHDENICEVPEIGAEESLQNICELMSVAPIWAKGLPLGAEGYVTQYYKKD